MASNQKKQIPWFLSRAGRGFSFFSAIAVGVGGSFLYILPNALFSERFSKIYQMYKGAVEVPVSAEIENLADDVMNKLGMHQNDKNLCKFFTAYGFDIMHIGSTYSKYGVSIGIPSNFYCKTITDIDAPNIRVKGEPVNLDSEAGKSMLNSLLLSDKAKKFAIGTQIHEANSFDMYVKSVLPAVNVLAFYTISQKINQRHNLYSKPAALRGLIYLSLGTFMLGTYFLFQDANRHETEKSADKTISSLSLELAEGGVEFYGKLLQRNKMLRELLGTDGDALFTPSGDASTLIRTPNVPLTHRLDFCKKNLAAIKENPGLIQTFQAPRTAFRLPALTMDSTPASVQEEMARMNK